jgi:SAM-dependent methyltransferase
MTPYPGECVNPAAVAPRAGTLSLGDEASGPAISGDALLDVFRLKYGGPEAHGWGPRMRLRFGHFTPDDYYEALVAQLVGDGCAWVDVGCGRDIFPNNRPLAARLAGRCETLVGVDPDDNLDENPLVKERAKTTIDHYRSDLTFDLVTLRMVAEHVTDPDAAVASLARLTRPGGRVVVYTVNRWSPVSLAAKAIPFGLHHAFKRALWKTEERDTFPVAYRMNTRGALRRAFGAHGFREAGFAYLDDCRTFGRFRVPHYLELSAWRALRALGLRYPENCLLGVYQRLAADRPGRGPGR